MSILSDLCANPTLQQYAQGAAQEAVNPIADFLAPVIPVSVPTGKYKVYTEKDRFQIPDARRAMGGPATQVRFEASDATFSCTPRAYDYPVDNLEQLASEALENHLMEGARAIAEMAALSHEKNVIDAALAAAGSGTTISCAATDPIAALDSAILSVLKAARYGSLMGVGVVVGATAFLNIKNAAKVNARFVTGVRATGAVNGSLTEELLSSILLGNPDVRTSFMVYDSANVGQTSSINFVLDSDVLVFARKANPTRRDPSFMKTFRLADKYMVPGSYMSPDQRCEIAKFDWSEAIVVTNTSAVSRLTINA